jgi:hypothetical protein
VSEAPLSVAQAAARTGASQATIKRQLDAGHISGRRESVRPGGGVKQRWAIDRESLDLWAAARAPTRQTTQTRSRAQLHERIAALEHRLDALFAAVERIRPRPDAGSQSPAEAVLNRDDVLAARAAVLHEKAATDHALEAGQQQAAAEGSRRRALRLLAEAIQATLEAGEHDGAAGQALAQALAARSGALTDLLTPGSPPLDETDPPPD